MAAEEEIENWDRMRRFEKIEKLKKRWRDSKGEEMNISRNNTKPETEVSWSVWRKKKKKVCFMNARLKRGQKRRGDSYKITFPPSDHQYPLPSLLTTKQEALE